MSLAVVGVAFPNKGKAPTRRFEIALCAPGDRVELRPELKNPADSRAIAVYSERDVQLGYITAERAPRIGQLLKSCEISAIFQAATPYGAIIRIAFDGDRPELPLVKEQKVEAEPDFYPDEIWPDD
jgi:hypothetical protein